MTATVAEPGAEVELPTQSIEDLRFEIECEIPARMAATGAHGLPDCTLGPARWVAWRANCCPQSPRYLLMCDYCRRVYQRWDAMGAHLTCVECDQPAGFIRYEPLNRNA